MNEVYVRDNGTRGVRTFTTDPSRTKQSMRDECDINGIMKRFERTGIVTHNAVREAYFSDVSVVPDFAEAIEIVRKAENMFMSMPAKLRAFFENDPARYVQFCSDPVNADKMVELGLREPKPAVTPVVVPPVGGGA